MERKEVPGTSDTCSDTQERLRGADMSCLEALYCRFFSAAPASSSSHKRRSLPFLPGEQHEEIDRWLTRSCLVWSFPAHGEQAESLVRRLVNEIIHKPRLQANTVVRPRCKAQMRRRIKRVKKMYTFVLWDWSFRGMSYSMCVASVVLFKPSCCPSIDTEAALEFHCTTRRTPAPTTYMYQVHFTDTSYYIQYSSRRK